MAEGYVKVLSSILDSSIWAEPDDMVKVWMTMLAMADRDGYIGASVGGITRRSVTVSQERVTECLEAFQAPDTDSRSPNDDGRRIKRVDRGWVILNYRKIRDMYGTEAKQAAKRRWWSDNKGMPTDGTDPEMSSECSSGSSGSSKVLDNAYVNVSSLLDLSPPDLKRKRPAVKSPPPDTFTANAATLESAKRFGRDWQSDWEACRDWALSKGESRIDWQATLRSWMRNAKNYERGSGYGGNNKKQYTPPQPNSLTHPVIPNEPYKEGNYVDDISNSETERE